MASPYLNIQAVTTGQNNKEVTINDADMALERATNDIVSIDMAAADVVVTVAQFTRNMVLRCINAGVNRILTVPNNVGVGAQTAKRVFSVINDSTVETNLTITTGVIGGTTVILKKGMRALLSSDGTNIRLLTIAGGSSGISIAAYVPGATPPASVILRYTAVLEFTLPAGLTGSFASLTLAPDGGSVAFDLRQNNVSFGSMTFADASTVATFSLASPRVFAPGDVLSVTSPADVFDIADLSFTLLGQ